MARSRFHLTRKRSGQGKGISLTVSVTVPQESLSLLAGILSMKFFGNLGGGSSSGFPSVTERLLDDLFGTGDKPDPETAEADKPEFPFPASPESRLPDEGSACL